VDFIPFYLGILLFLATIRISGFGLYFAEQFRSFLALYGWYEDRRLIQLVTLSVVLIPTSIFTVLEARKYFLRSKMNLLALLGTYTLLFIVAMTFISYHYTDKYLMYQLGNITIASLVEGSALIMIILSQIPHTKLHSMS
jgi:hypothetical protein